MADGQVRVALRQPWADETAHVVFDPVELIEQAAVIVRILEHLDIPTDLPVARPARAPPLFAAAEEAHADEDESAP